ncbi:MAG TPA: hypothetical protein VKM93_15165 [Terriglobia bacterium]|nr:hypothetical protein [Terriglobia bacterium]
MDLIEKWCEAQTCPAEYPGTMRELYGECPTLAGERIRLLIIDYFGDDEAAMHKACEELPKWFEQERNDVEQERELYHREMTIREKAGPNLTQEYVDKKEAALERQLREHTRLLLQLKTKRSEIGNKEQGTGKDREHGEVAPGVAVRSGGRRGGPARGAGIFPAIRRRNATRHRRRRFLLPKP